jgi:hypothetical protein
MSTQVEETNSSTKPKGSSAVLNGENESTTTTNATAKTAVGSDVKVENFSTLAARLRAAETGRVKNSKGLQEVRQAVVEAAQRYHTSRYNLGKALRTYKECFAEDRGWMMAAKEIGVALECCERTIRNIVADYLRASKLPESVIAAAEVKGLDLAERKHAPLVKVLENELAGNEAPTIPEAQQILGKVLKISAAPATKATLHKAEKLRWEVRLKIRTALTNVAPDAKLSELLAALEEEMHDVWGMTKPITFTITPKPGKLDITGKRVAA